MLEELKELVTRFEERLDVDKKMEGQSRKFTKEELGSYLCGTASKELVREIEEDPACFQFLMELQNPESLLQGNIDELSQQKGHDAEFEI